MIYWNPKIRVQPSVESRWVVADEAVLQSLELSASVCAASEAPSQDQQF
jgi:hypothetical protein